MGEIIGKILFFLFTLPVLIVHEAYLKLKELFQKSGREVDWLFVLLLVLIAILLLLLLFRYGYN
jgi:hypothetical protein